MDSREGKQYYESGVRRCSLPWLICGAVRHGIIVHVGVGSRIAHDRRQFRRPYGRPSTTPWIMLGVQGPFVVSLFLCWSCDGWLSPEVRLHCCLGITPCNRPPSSPAENMAPMMSAAELRASSADPPSDDPPATAASASDAARRARWGSAPVARICLFDRAIIRCNLP